MHRSALTGPLVRTVRTQRPLMRWTGEWKRHGRAESARNDEGPPRATRLPAAWRRARRHRAVLGVPRPAHRGGPPDRSTRPRAGAELGLGVGHALVLRVRD